MTDETVELFNAQPDLATDFDEYDNNEVVTEGILEARMDNEGGDNTRPSDGITTQPIPTPMGSRFALGPRFNTIYKGLLRQTQGRQAVQTKLTKGDFKGQLAMSPTELHRYVENLESVIMEDPSAYTPEQLEQELNSKRGMLGVWIKDRLHSKLRLLINLGSRFSLLHQNFFYLHYSPTGVLPVDGDDLNHMRDNQCCVHTAWSKLLNFLINENNNVDMEAYKFGGKAVVTDSKYAAFGDLIPFDLEKKDKVRDMISQYEYWADQLGMDSIEELMAISYSLARMHLLLHRVTPDRTNEMKVHIMSSATAQYISGYKGFKKYLMKLVSKDWYSVTYGPHPQESPR